MKRYALFTILVLAAFLVVACGEKKEPENKESKTALEEVKKEVKEASEAGRIMASKSGEEIYNKFCVSCHAAGVAGAPKLGDKTAWEPRLKKDKNDLFNSVWNGFNAMPPRGLCMECSEEDIKHSIGFMLSKIK